MTFFIFSSQCIHWSWFNAFIGHDLRFSIVKKNQTFSQSITVWAEFWIWDMWSWNIEITSVRHPVILSSCHPTFLEPFPVLFSWALKTKSLFCIHKGIMVGPGLYISTGLRGNLRGSSQPMNELDFDFLSWLITRAVRERWFQETRRAEFHRHSQLSRGWLF